MLHGRELISTELWRRWTGDQARWTRVDEDASFSSSSSFFFFFVSSPSLELLVKAVRFLSRPFIARQWPTQLDPAVPTVAANKDRIRRRCLISRKGARKRRRRRRRSDGISGRWMRPEGMREFFNSRIFLFLWKMIIVGSNAMERLKIEGFVMVTHGIFAEIIGARCGKFNSICTNWNSLELDLIWFR